MAWAGGTFTRANPTWATDASLGIGIEAGRHDAQDNDFTTGINQCLNKDGSNSCTGNLNLGGYLPTNVAAGTAAAPAYCPGNDVNTGMYGPAADTLAFATNGSERMRIGTSVAYTTIPFGINATPRAPLDVQTTEITAQYATNYANAVNGYNFIFQKSRGTTIGTNTIVANGDTLGAIVFQGANGTNYTNAATIGVEVDGAPGATNDMPGRLVFSTTADGSGSTTERMRIAANGRIAVGTTSTTPGKFVIRGEDTGVSNWSLWVEDSAGAQILGTRNSGLIQTGTKAESPYNLTTGSAANLHVDNSGSLLRSTSSLRYKSNVETATHGLAEVLQLRSVTFNATNSGDTIFGGLIAEEVHEVGLHEFVVYNADNEPDALHYGNMVALAFKAIQELNAKVEALEAKVADLEAVTEL